jgi:uncharacterized C2H2 Zn-finger protein
MRQVEAARLPGPSGKGAESAASSDTVFPIKERVKKLAEAKEIPEMVCPKCGKTYKRENAYEKHVASCKGKAKATIDARSTPKVKKTPEELAEARRAYVKVWVKGFTTTTVRLKNDSDEEEFLLEAEEEIKNDFPNAGRATVFKLLLCNAMGNEDIDISELANQYLAEDEEEAEDE